MQMVVLSISIIVKSPAKYWMIGERPIRWKLVGSTEQEMYAILSAHFHITQVNNKISTFYFSFWPHNKSALTFDVIYKMSDHIKRDDKSRHEPL